MIRQLRQGRATVLVVGASSLLIGILLSLVITRSIVVPITHGIGSLVRIAGGDLAETLDLKRRDECGQLATAMNAMAAKLALNAAIEAARAGEHGKGSAVVAFFRVEEEGGVARLPRIKRSPLLSRAPTGAAEVVLPPRPAYLT